MPGETPVFFVMKYNIITAFPELYENFISTSLIKKASDKKLIEFNIIDLKNFGIGSYNKIDDTIYGGGAGMLIRVDVMKRALDSIEDKGTVIALTPTGSEFNQKSAHSLCSEKSITVLCGRYEGFDERIYDYVNKKISVGKYITMGGEIPSMIIIEAVSRLIPGVLGNTDSTKQESHTNKIIKEYPNYTKPKIFEGKKVPEILMSGNHDQIRNWREKNTEFIEH